MDKHPITPPPELVSKWCYEDGEEIKSSPRWFFSVCAKAAQWGADQELDACCLWVNSVDDDDCFGANLRAARRPKPPSLKQQALDLLRTELESGEEVASITLPAGSIDTIRRALESLPDD